MKLMIFVLLQKILDKVLVSVDKPNMFSWNSSLLTVFDKLLLSSPFSAYFLSFEDRQLTVLDIAYWNVSGWDGHKTDQEETKNSLKTLPF